MISVQGEFEIWREIVFDRPLPQDQARCVEAAFFAGVKACLNALNEDGALMNRNTTAEARVAAALGIADEINQHLRRFMS